MELVDFGKRNGLKVPRANIGAMRLPQNEDEAVALIRHAIDSGMRYIDTSRGYGDSEIKLGKALKDGYREKVILSTKWSPWITKVEESDDTSAGCMRKRIEESMKRLDVDCLDYYQIWNIDSREHYDQAIARGGMLEGIQKAVSEGLVRRIGFTTHDKPESLLGYVDEVDWCDIILISYNLLYRDYAEVLEAAHSRGIGTIIMNPVGGGGLAQPSALFDDLARKAGASSGADLAIRYLMSDPNIDTLICGITKTSDVDDTIRSVHAGGLPAAAVREIERVLDEIAATERRFCTSCKYCMPCPAGIDIPRILRAVFLDRHLGFRQRAERDYQSLEGPRADACTECDECEEKCPQKLAVTEHLKYAAANYAATS